MFANTGSAKPSRGDSSRRHLRSPLGPAQEAQLREGLRAGDATARARLAEAFVPAVSCLAAGLRVDGMSRDDLLQEARLALIEALDSYPGGHDEDLSAHVAAVVTTHLAALAMGALAKTQDEEAFLKGLEELDALEGQLVKVSGRSPTTAEIAQRLEWRLGKAELLRAHLREARARAFGEDLGEAARLLNDAASDGLLAALLAEIEDDWDV